MQRTHDASTDDDPQPRDPSALSLRARLAHQRFGDGADAALILSLRSGYRLDRALTRRLSHRFAASQSMRGVIRAAVAELLAMGLTEVAILTLLSQMVEQLASALGLEKRSLLTGQPDWLSTQAEVVELARFELRA